MKYSATLQRRAKFLKWIDFDFFSSAKTLQQNLHLKLIFSHIKILNFEFFWKKCDGACWMSPIQSLKVNSTAAPPKNIKIF